MKENSRKQELISAFIKLYEEKDISQINVRELCDNVTMSRTAFYHYYSDVYEMLQDILDNCIANLARMNKDFYRLNLQNKDEMKPCYDTLYYIMERQEMFRALLRHQGTNNFVYLWKNIIKQDFRRKYQFQNHSTANLDIILELTASAIVGLYEYWLYHLDEISVDEVAEGIYYQLCHTLV